MAEVYNSAYGYSLGIATLAGVFEDNCAVTSEARVDRRFYQLTLAFAATVSEAKAVSASTNAAKLTPASFAAGISSASSAQGVTVPVPSADQISGVTVTVITTAPTTQPSVAPTSSTTTYSYTLSGYSSSDFDETTTAGQNMRTSLTTAFAETVGINSTKVTLGDIVDTGRRSSVVVPFVVSASNLIADDVNVLMTSTSASGFGQLFVAAAAQFGLTVAAPVVAVFDESDESSINLMLYLIIASASIVLLLLITVLLIVVVNLGGCCLNRHNLPHRCLAKKCTRRKDTPKMSKDELFISTMTPNCL